MTPQPQPTHYTVLSLPSSEPLDTQTLKKAYRRALLSHHPDKSQQQQQQQQQQKQQQSSATTYTIDQISLAYATLSSPSLKQAYDKSLLLATKNNNNHNGLDINSTYQTSSKFQTGIETTDLDDLDYDPSKNQWYRSCRCGNPRGYLFGEGDLEDAADLGELMVGCADCSLWLRVHFAVVEEDGDEKDQDQDIQKTGAGEKGDNDKAN